MFDFLKRKNDKNDKSVKKTDPTSEAKKDTRPFDHYLDCRNMLCPKPIYELSQKMKQIDGGIIKIECRDNAFPPDMKVWTNRMNVGLELFKEDDVHVAYVTVDKKTTK